MSLLRLLKDLHLWNLSLKKSLLQMVQDYNLNYLNKQWLMVVKA